MTPFEHIIERYFDLLDKYNDLQNMHADRMSQINVLEEEIKRDKMKPVIPLPPKNPQRITHIGDGYAFDDGFRKQIILMGYCVEKTK